MNYLSRSTALLLAWLLMGLLHTGHARAKSSCDQDWICIRADETETGVTLVGQNLKPHPVTLSIRIQTENLRAQQRPEGTVTLAGSETRILASYTKRRNERSYYYSYRYDWTVGELDPDQDADYRYALPYASGTAWPVLQGFGSRFSHTGRERYAVDFRMPEGTPVHAARAGAVVKVVEAHDKGCWQDDCGRYANYIVVLHNDGTTGEYYHLKHQGAAVSEGQRVRRGQHIGYSGNTGHSTMAHLHFAVYRAGSWGRTQSLPFKLETRSGVISRPQRGQRYVAP